MDAQQQAAAPQVRRLEFEGKAYEFPADFTDADVAKMLGGSAAPKETRTVGGDLLDVGKGFAKGAGRMVIDLANLSRYNPVAPTYLMSPEVRRPDWMNPTNLRQAQGMAGFDITSLVPIGMGTSSARVVPKVATMIERKAVPALTKEGAEFALSRGAGRVSARSAEKLTEMARGAQGARTAAGQWEKAPAGLRNAREAISAAAKQSRPITNAEALATLGSGALLQSPETALAIGALQFLRRPKVASAIAQGLQTSAPLTQGAGGMMAAALMRLFGDDE